MFLIVLFFIIAAVYASAGFGGGSSYLAVMALCGVGVETMKPTALLCNIVVVIGGTYIFWKNGNLDFKKVIPLSIWSIPLAFLGGKLKLEEKTFFLLLGFGLIVAAILMLIPKKQADNAAEESKPHWMVSSGLGGGIGFFSGVVGIGGGIFLSPILNLLKWDLPKNIAAAASFFILVNSVAGLLGQLSKNAALDWAFVLPLMAAVLVGGQIGSRFNALKMNQRHVQQVTALLVLYAGVNILWNHL